MKRITKTLSTIQDDVKKFDYLHEVLDSLTVGNALDLLSMIDTYVEDTVEEKELMKKVIKDIILSHVDERYH